LDYFARWRVMCSVVEQVVYRLD